MKINRVNEEKMLNDMFVLLEYSDTFYDFVMSLPEETFKILQHHVKLREIKGEDKGIIGV
jgi:hypothetical protein